MNILAENHWKLPKPRNASSPRCRESQDASRHPGMSLFPLFQIYILSVDISFQCVRSFYRASCFCCCSAEAHKIFKQAFEALVALASDCILHCKTVIEHLPFQYW